MRARLWKLGLGTLVAQLFNFVALPFLTHIFRPEAYSGYLLCMTISGLILPLVTFKLDIGITTATERQLQLNLFILIIKYLVLALIFTSIPLMFSSIGYESNSINPFLKNLFYVLIILLLQVLTVMGIGLAIYKDNVNKVSTVAIIQNFSTAVLQIVFSSISAVKESLIFGFLVGRIVSLLNLSRIFWDSFSHNASESNTKISLAYLKSRKYLVLSAFADGANLSLPLLCCFLVLSKSQISILGISQTLLLAPVTLINSTITNSLLSRFGSQVENKDFDRSSNATLKKIWLFVIGASIAVAIIEIIACNLGLINLLGKSWSQTSSVILVLIFPFAIQIGVNPLISIMYLRSAWKEYFVFNFLALITGFVTFLICWYLDISWVVTATSFFMGRSIFWLVVGIHAFNREWGV